MTAGGVIPAQDYDFTKRRRAISVPAQCIPVSAIKMLEIPLTQNNPPKRDVKIASRAALTIKIQKRQRP